MPPLRIIVVLAVLASAAAVAGSVYPAALLTASALPVPSPSATETYLDPVYGFTFEYPAGLAFSTAEDGHGHVIFGDTQNGETLILVAVRPYLFDEPLTADILRFNGAPSDIEGRPLPSGTTAFLFQRADTPLGASRDAVFARRGFQYHISVPVDQEQVLLRVLETWTFGK